MEFTASARRGPRRLATVVAEVLAALALIGLAWWCWHRGVIVTVHRGVAMNRIEGGWWAVATGSITIAGIMLLDAARRTMADPLRA